MAISATLVFLDMDHIEFRVWDPLSLANCIVNLFDCDASEPSKSGTVMVNLLMGPTIELKKADVNHPVCGSVIALDVRDNQAVIEFLCKKGIEPNLSLIGGDGNGPIFFSVAHRNDKIDFHTIIKGGKPW